MLGALMLTLHAQPRSRFWSLMTFLHQNSLQLNPLPVLRTLEPAPVLPLILPIQGLLPVHREVLIALLRWSVITTIQSALALQRSYRTQKDLDRDRSTKPQSRFFLPSEKIILSDKGKSQQQLPGSHQCVRRVQTAKRMLAGVRQLSRIIAASFFLPSVTSVVMLPHRSDDSLYLAEDLCGNTNSCTFNITVSGTCCKTKPKIQCPADYSGCPGDSLNEDHTGKNHRSSRR